MAWKLFGNSVTKRIALNTLACGEGRFGIRETYDRYFFGIKIRENATQDVCYDESLAPPDYQLFRSLLRFDASPDKRVFIAERTYKIDKDGKTGWYRWTCKEGGKSGIEPTKSAAKQSGKANCGLANFDVEEVNVLSLALVFQEQKFS